MGEKYPHVGSHVKASSGGIDSSSVPQKIFFLKPIATSMRQTDLQVGALIHDAAKHKGGEGHRPVHEVANGVG
jgi:hypothetical protein